MIPPFLYHHQPRPRTPDGTKPTKGTTTKARVQSWTKKPVWVDTLPTRPVTVVTSEANVNVSLQTEAPTTTTITPWVQTTTTTTTTSTTTLTT